MLKIKTNLNIIVVITLLMIFFTDCSKQEKWTTDSPVARENFLKGKDLHNAFNNEKAKDFYLQAFKADSNFAVLSLMLADIYYDTGVKDSVKYFLEKAFENMHNASRFEQLLIARARANFQFNREKAMRIEDSLLTEFPNRLDSKVIKAQQFFQKGDYTKAREMYFNILKDHPEYAMAYNMIGYSYALQGYHRDALEYFRKYLEVAPNILNPWDSLAEFYLITGRYHETIQLLKNLIDTKKELLDQNRFMTAVIYLKIADAYKYLGQYDEAIDHAEIAKQIHPPVRPIHQINHFLFNLYYELNEIDKMRQEYERVKDQISRFEANYMKIILDIANNNYGAAEKEINNFYSKSQNKNKNYVKYIAILQGELAFAQERYAIAADNFKTAAAIFSDIYPEKLENKHYISLGRDGKIDEAIMGFQKILEKNPNNPVSLLNISKFYHQQEKDQKAGFYLDHFFSLWSGADPDSPMMKDAKQLKKELTEG
ncbi:MAG: tetratricopeptide repeat protein [Fidelibacterota bacterium]